MIDLVDIRYCRFGTDDLECAVTFATETAGLELVGRGPDCAYLRADDRDHNLCYFKGDPRDHTVAFELTDWRALDDAAAQLAAAGVPFERGTPEGAAARRVMGYLTLRDPTGNKIDLVTRPFHSGKRFFRARDVRMTEFSHIGLKTSDPVRDEMFWTTVFNMRAHDWLGPAGLLSFDAVHHRVAPFPAKEPGVQHMNFQVDALDDVERSIYVLREKQVKIVFGPGRHPLSGAAFCYFAAPHGMVFEYSCGVPSLGDDWRARQFPWEPLSLDMWGGKADIEELKA
ncbi:MAG TPA: VOC family protein [Alphaproteobacteria bacterium]